MEWSAASNSASLETGCAWPDIEAGSKIPRARRRGNKTNRAFFLMESKSFQSGTSQGAGIYHKQEAESISRLIWEPDSDIFAFRA
jgi:hypothetical protein